PSSPSRGRFAVIWGTLFGITVGVTVTLAVAVAVGPVSCAATVPPSQYHAPSASRAPTTRDRWLPYIVRLLAGLFHAQWPCASGRGGRRRRCRHARALGVDVGDELLTERAKHL